TVPITLVAPLTPQPQGTSGLSAADRIRTIEGTITPIRTPLGATNSTVRIARTGSDAPISAWSTGGSTKPPSTASTASDAPAIISTRPRRARGNRDDR